jgi:hypothetical protein
LSRDLSPAHRPHRAQDAPAPVPRRAP